MYKKTFFKIILVLLVGVFAIYFTLNKETVENLANGLFNKPINVTISNVTDTSFTVFWQTRIQDKSLLLVTTDKNQLFTKSSLIFDQSHQYIIDSRDIDSSIYYEIHTKSKINDLGLYTNHFVTINGLEPNTNIYFAISNGLRIWQVDPGNTLFGNNMQNPFYYKVATKSFDSELTLPQPIVLSIDSDNNNFDFLNSVVMIKNNNASIYSYISSSQFTVVDGSKFIKGNDIIELKYLPSEGDYLYKTFVINSSDLDIDKRLISFKDEASKNRLQSIISTVNAKENICCALQIEDEEEFFGSNYPSIETCKNDNGVVIPNITTDRACNTEFTSVCCNYNDEYNWVPEISCPINQVLNLQYNSCFKEKLDIKKYSVKINPGDSSFLLSFQPVYTKESNFGMSLKDILTVINSNDRVVHWISAYDKETSTWKYAVELANGQTVSNAFIPSKDTLIYYHATAATNFSILGLK